VIRQQAIRETQIPGGPLVISKPMSGVQTVALGIWLDVGSRDESPELAGISHALEHMLFKGTESHDAQMLSRMLDDLGGHVNAFTTRERTCFHAHCLFEDWPRALALLSEMLLFATIPEEEWQRERDVIFSEMRMLEDTPDDWLLDQHMQALFPGQEVGRPVLGNPESLMEIERQDLLDYLRTNYRPPRLLIAAAGRIDHDALVETVVDSHWPKGREKKARRRARPHGGIQHLGRDIEQAYMAVSFRGIPAASGQRPVAWVANHLLGGGMSSRLFQEVREKRGLAYSIGSQLSSLTDMGTWTIHGATDPDRFGACVDVIRETLICFGREGVSPDELAEAKRQVQIQLRMGMDSVEQNMFRLGARFDEDEVHDIPYWLDAVEQVSLDELCTWIREHLLSPSLWSFCGPETCHEQVKTLETRLHL